MPGDQGGFVEVNWTPSGYDVPNQTTVSYYSIWRATDSLNKEARLVTLEELASGVSGPVVRKSSAGDFYWEYVGQQTAHAFPAYSYATATRANGEPHWFQVVTHTFSQFTVFPSMEATGSSVDNLAPGPPQSLLATRAGGSSVDLEWSPSPEPDLQQYAVYRSTEPNVVVGPDNLLLTSTEETAVDDVADPSDEFYYVVVAIDVNANPSPPSNEAMVEADPATPAPESNLSFLVRPNQPNPFGAGTRVDYRLGKAGEIRLEVFDLRGRRVRRLERGASAGWNELHFDGRDSEGTPLPSGVYFYRVSTGSESRVHKMMIQR